MENKVAPYDTGKVKIGIYYIPPNNRVMSQDELRIQSALLDTQPDTKPSRLRAFVNFVMGDCYA